MCFIALTVSKTLELLDQFKLVQLHVFSELSVDMSLHRKLSLTLFTF